MRHYMFMGWWLRKLFTKLGVVSLITLCIIGLSSFFSPSALASDCSISEFSVTPGNSSQPTGTTLTLHGRGNCSGGIRASRFEIDGGGFGEDAGTGSQDETWILTEGTHNICFAIAGGSNGDWSAGAYNCTTITGVGSSGSGTNPTANGPQISEQAYCVWYVYYELAGFAPNSAITVSSAYSETVCRDGSIVNSSWSTVGGTTDANGRLAWAALHQGTGSYNYTFTDQLGNTAISRFTTGNVASPPQVETCGAVILHDDFGRQLRLVESVPDLSTYDFNDKLLNIEVGNGYRAYTYDDPGYGGYRRGAFEPGIGGGIGNNTSSISIEKTNNCVQSSGNPAPSNGNGQPTPPQPPVDNSSPSNPSQPPAPPSIPPGNPNSQNCSGTPSVGSSNAPNGEWVKIVAYEMAIRTGSGRDNPCIARASRDKYLPFIRTENGWYLVRWSNGEGWVSSGQDFTLRGTTTDVPSVETPPQPHWCSHAVHLYSDGYHWNNGSIIPDPGYYMLLPTGAWDGNRDHIRISFFQVERGWIDATTIYLGQAIVDVGSASPFEVTEENRAGFGNATPSNYYRFGVSSRFAIPFPEWRIDGLWNVETLCN